MKKIKFILLSVIYLLLMATFAHAAEIIFRPIITPYGVKIYLDNLTSDFDLSSQDEVITLQFNEKIISNDQGNWTKSVKLIDKVLADSQSLNIFAKSKNIRVEKFEEGFQQGINIYDLSLEAATSPKENVEASVKESANSIKITFNWDTEVGNATYQRGDKLWMVFDKFADVVKLAGGEGNVPIKQIHLPAGDEVTLVSFDISQYQNKYSRIFAYKTGNSWTIEMSNKNAKPNSFLINTKVDETNNPIVEVELNSKAGRVIKFIDPDVQDQLIVIPHKSGGYAVNNGSKYIDFKILPSYQGTVIEQIADDLNVATKYQFIQISSGKNNNHLNILAKTDPKVEPVQLVSVRQSTDKSILNLKEYLVEDETFANKISELHQTLTKIDSLDQRIQQYIKQSLFYLSNGFNNEALIMLKLLKQENPDYATDYKLKLIEGAIQFKKLNFVESEKLINSIDITDVAIAQRKEIRFWQAMISYAQRQTPEVVNKFDPIGFIINDNDTFLSMYPDSFKFDFIANLTSFKLDKGDFKGVEKFIDLMDKLCLNPRQLNRKMLIKGRFFAQQNKDQDALKQWDDCTRDWHDDLNFTQCQYAKAKFQYGINSITPKQYLETLSNLALTWRGDDLEITFLKELGDINLQNKDYINALRSYKTITNYYPYSPNAIELAKQINTIFVNFFTTGLDDEVSHLQAASMFYEFEDLIPIGAIGDEVVLKFTDHLIALDLLDRAANLLNHQILYRVQGYRKEKIINKLAEIYIKNQHPELAIDLIFAADPIEALPENIAVDRKYILATAYYKNEQVNDALKLLEKDDSVKADDIRSQIYWEEKDWENLNKSIEPGIYKIRDQSDDLSTDEAINVLKLAISYLILGEVELTKNLFQDFRDRMPKQNINSDLLNALDETWQAVRDNRMSAINDLTKIEQKIINLMNMLKQNDKKPAIQ